MLTKPQGALGTMEGMAILLATMQGRINPSVDNVHIVVFAADHGIAAEGISAFPQAVTAEMIRNFSNGGAAISVLASELGAKLNVVNLGTVTEIEPLTGVSDMGLGHGTANFLKSAAMTEAQLARAINCGRQQAERCALEKAQLFIGGEMGIGNTTSATAIACQLLATDALALVGPGTGLDPIGMKHKASVINQALALHKEKLDSPLKVLQYLGGFEIAALVGAYIAAAKMGLPVLIDGYIATVAALTAERISPGASNWFIYSHVGAEPSHKIVVDELGGVPLLDFKMRLGEGSGAAIAVPILRLACALHNKMATFSEADVSEQI